MNKRNKIKSLKAENKWLLRQNRELIEELFKNGKTKKK
jgi:hypothetical protein